MNIDDGTGKGNLAKVDSSNRLHTDAVTKVEGVEANLNGDAYNINTGILSLTNATETPVLYLKNNESRSLSIDGIVIGLFGSTGGDASADVYSTIVRNPTTGTTISNANDVSINSNRNYGSSNTLASIAYKGATGETMTNGDDHIIVRVSPGSRSFLSINELLQKGNSIGIKIKPPVGNTAMSVYVAVICHLISSD